MKLNLNGLSVEVVCDSKKGPTNGWDSAMMAEAACTVLCMMRLAGVEIGNFIVTLELGSTTSNHHRNKGCCAIEGFADNKLGINIALFPNDTLQTGALLSREEGVPVGKVYGALSTYYRTDYNNWFRPNMIKISGRVIEIKKEILERNPGVLESQESATVTLPARGRLPAASSGSAPAAAKPVSPVSEVCEKPVAPLAKKAWPSNAQHDPRVTSAVLDLIKGRLKEKGEPGKRFDARMITLWSEDSTEFPFKGANAYGMGKVLGKLYKDRYLEVNQHMPKIYVLSVGLQQELGGVQEPTEVFQELEVAPQKVLEESPQPVRVVEPVHSEALIPSNGNGDKESNGNGNGGGEAHCVPVSRSLPVSRELPTFGVISERAAVFKRAEELKSVKEQLEAFEKEHGALEEILEDPRYSGAADLVSDPALAELVSKIQAYNALELLPA